MASEQAAPYEEHPLEELVAEGVSPWVEGITRDRIASGYLARLVRRTGVRGATTDLAALLRALTRTTAYREQLVRYGARDASAEAVLREILVRDARSACDCLRGVFEETGGADGLVSVDLDPRHAHDAAAAVADAVAVAGAVDRPNALVKIPATPQGLRAAADCLGRGIGVQITEIFSVRRYEAAVAAYFEGLERALAAGRRLSAIASVAAFPVARLDAGADARLAALGTPDAERLRGTAGTATARLAYEVYEEWLGRSRWRPLRAAGARPQRLMWTDALAAPPPRARYVDRLVAWGTVSAMSPPVLETAVRSCALRGDTLSGQAEAARTVWERLERAGVPSEAVAAELSADGVRRLADRWRRLLAVVADELAAA
ncbi:transaldolase family protein [Streptomyces sp. TRM 70361]|uniref:transaldolase family protein n=1 Tax=Streptomyces sp. TRM 70361 TaxID=3116553 RepID=UPI002E7B657F|nr:transaldolase family protein [Streptomyces sp. TRM 70361]MEE1940151.1 transaldolase family protein [Streptomyces sp. TRM 70361]